MSGSYHPSKAAHWAGASLRILYIGALPPHHGGGGAAIVGFQVIRGLADLGHKVTALAPAVEEVLTSLDSFDRAHPEISIARFPVKAYPVPYFAADDPASAESERLEGEGIRRGFHAAVANTRPHVVIVGRAYFVWHVAELARAAGIPFVVLIHDNSVISRIVPSYRDAIGEKLLSELRHAACIVAVANHLASAMQATGLTNVNVIPNAVDQHQFAPRPKDPAMLSKLGLKPEHKVVLHASNMRPAKRPLDLIESAQQVLGRRSDVIYVVAGEGPLRSDMEAACRRHGLDRQFRFIGWIDHDRMPDLINLADVVLMPSAREGRALTYLETQACGRVLVASDIAAAREVIHDGETALLFRMGDVADLTEKILLALGDADLRLAIGQRAREAFAQRSFVSFIASYERILLDVAGLERIR